MDSNPRVEHRRNKTRTQCVTLGTNFNQFPLFALLEKDYLESLSCTFHEDPNTLVKAYERMVPSETEQRGPYKILV